jgi:hypothetical protein
MAKEENLHMIPGKKKKHFIFEAENLDQINFKKPTTTFTPTVTLSISLGGLG